jgi:hypothetical protein
LTDTTTLIAEMADFEWRHPKSAIIGRPNPAVATGFTYACPGTVEQVVQAVTFKLVTDNQAASRIAVLSFLDQDGTAFAAVASGFTQAASTTTVYTFAYGIQEFGANDAANIGVPIPAFKLTVGLSLALTITAKQTGDQVSDVRLAVEQFNVRP